MNSRTPDNPANDSREPVRMSLSEADRGAFLAALDNPPVPNAALRAAAALWADARPIT